MRSSELARLAGVSVRTLRHYHQISILAEPERSSNGYRCYSVHDLIRVLRIKRLAALGIALEKTPELLDAPTDSTTLLDELDKELATQIAQLTHQRKIIAQLRANNAAPDLPPELAPFLAILGEGLEPDLARFDREQSVLLAHLAGSDGTAYIARFYEQLSTAERIPQTAEISKRFNQLGAESSEQELADLVEIFVQTFGPVIKQFQESTPPIDLSPVADIFAAHTTDSLNPQQRLALKELELRLSELDGGGG